MPPPLSSLWPPKRLATPSRRQRSSSFPWPIRSHAHRCSNLTRPNGGEQSGLVTLTCDHLTLKVVSESRVTWATSVPILVFLDLSVLNLGPKERQTDVRQHHRSIRGGVINMLRGTYIMLAKMNISLKVTSRWSYIKLLRIPLQSRWINDIPMSSNVVPAVVVNTSPVPRSQRHDVVVIRRVPSQQWTTVDNVERHERQPAGRQR